MEPVETPRIYSGRYELTHLIARGGMAQVYRAMDLQLERPVALKVLFPELSVDRTFVVRLRREALPPQHRPGLRLGGGRRVLLHRHGVCGGSAPLGRPARPATDASPPD